VNHLHTDELMNGGMAVMGNMDIKKETKKKKKVDAKASANAKPIKSIVPQPERIEKAKKDR
jgi:hypothetical protein